MQLDEKNATGECFCDWTIFRGSELAMKKCILYTGCLKKHFPILNAYNFLNTDDRGLILVSFESCDL